MCIVIGSESPGRRADTHVNIGKCTRGKSSPILAQSACSERPPLGDAGPDHVDYALRNLGVLQGGACRPRRVTLTPRLVVRESCGST